MEYCCLYVCTNAGEGPSNGGATIFREIKYTEYEVLGSILVQIGSTSTPWYNSIYRGALHLPVGSEMPIAKPRKLFFTQQYSHDDLTSRVVRSNLGVKSALFIITPKKNTCFAE